MAEPRCQLGEGLFITGCGERWWLDILQKRLIRWKDGDIRCFELPEMASKVLRIDETVITLASESGISTFDAKTRSFDVIQAAPPLSWNGMGRSNDACYLPDGSILVGRMDFEPKPNSGDVVRYSRAGCEVVLRDIAIPNTFIYLKDSQSVLISDSLSKRTYECELSRIQTEPLNKQLWKDFSGHAGTPDGGMLGDDGNVYIAMWGAACVAQLTRSGDMLNEAPVEALQPTSVQFDQVRQTMVVTSATEDMTQQQLLEYPQSGYVCTYAHFWDKQF